MKIFKNMTIKSRLLAMSALLLVFLAVAGGWSLFQFNKVNNSLSTVYKDRVLPLNQLAIVGDMYKEDLVSVAFQVRDGILSPEKGLEKLIKDQAYAKENWDAYVQTFLTPEEKELVEQAGPMLLNADKSVAVLKELLKNKDIPAISKYATQDMYPAIEPISKQIELLTGLQLHVAQNEYKEGQATYQFALWSIAGMTLLAIVVGLAMAVLVTQSINKPSAVIKSVIASVGAGDKTARAQLQSQDELGVLANAFDGLLDERLESEQKTEQLSLERLQAQQKAEAENDDLNNSVVAILQAMFQLSQRDLTVRAPVTQDIVGTVSDSINQMTDETCKVLSNVSEIAGNVEKGSNNVRLQAQMVTETAAADRLSVAQMLARLQDANESMNQVAELATQSSHSADQATQVTDSALLTVDSTVKGMLMIRETIAETEKRIKRLGERSQEINVIVNLINTVSERTHVLALNAAMQAAVAGEAGRGFAVVAEEVQRLAENSRNATQQIAALVNNIQLETNEAIATMNVTIGQVVNGSVLAQNAGESMRQTQKITSELAEQVRAIATASAQQKTMSIGLLTAIEDIGQSSERTSKQIELQNVETESLLGMARNLVSSVAVFKLPVRA